MREPIDLVSGPLGDGASPRPDLPTTRASMPRLDPARLVRLLGSFWLGTIAALVYHGAYEGEASWAHYLEEGAIVILTGFLVFVAIERARR
jgi:hypothetical protein